MTAVRPGLVLLLAAVLTMTGCVSPRAMASPRAVAGVGAVARAGAITKVLVIAEENHAYGDIIGSPNAPYLTALAGAYGNATHLHAGYPTACPSLAAYVLLTSGSTAGICDDRSPKYHRLAGDNIFYQVAAAGREWRNYAETAPRNCTLVNSRHGRYLVRHVPSTYYISERRRCGRWAVPMGEPSAGALHDDIAAGALPAFGFLSPDACHDMHGAAGCMIGRIGRGDRWLKSWLPRILAGPDYRAGRLVVVITWDEGTATGNHIPTLVISPHTRQIVARQLFTHCSTLRTIEELLRLPLLGCARRTRSMVAAFRL